MNVIESDRFPCFQKFKFQKSEGCIVYLYSLILSRQFNRLKQDLQGEKLLGDMEECKIALFNLVCNGVACPYLHNNSIYYDANGEPLVSALALRISLKKNDE